MRAASTVLDVAVFLALVGVAVATLGASTPVEDAPDAHETALLLSTSTTDVAYQGTAPGYHADGGSPNATARSRTVTAHGTYAGLLGRAALANASLESGERLSPQSGSFGRAVTAEVETFLAARPGRYEVRATWEPYPGAPVSGTHTVGRSPPPGVDVAARTLTVPAPVDPAPLPAPGPDGHQVETVADAIADGTIESVFETRRGAPRPVDPNSIEARRTVVRAAVRADLQDRYASSAVTRDAVDPGSLTVTVRRWEP